MLSDALPDTFIFHAAAFNVTVTFTLSALAPKAVANAVLSIVAV